MMINMKTSRDEGIADAPAMDILYLRLYPVRGYHAAYFSIRYSGEFPGKYKRWQYHTSSLHALGGYMVFPDLHAYQKNI